MSRLWRRKVVRWNTAGNLFKHQCGASPLRLRDCSTDETADDEAHEPVTTLVHLVNLPRRRGLYFDTNNTEHYHLLSGR